MNSFPCSVGCSYTILFHSLNGVLCFSKLKRLQLCRASMNGLVCGTKGSLDPKARVSVWSDCYWHFLFKSHRAQSNVGIISVALYLYIHCLKPFALNSVYILAYVDIWEGCMSVWKDSYSLSSSPAWTNCSTDPGQSCLFIIIVVLLGHYYYYYYYYVCLYIDCREENKKWGEEEGCWSWSGDSLGCLPLPVCSQEPIVSMKTSN